MAAKPDVPEHAAPADAAAKTTAPALPAEKGAAPPAAAARPGIGPWIPALAAVIAAPLASLAVAQFVMVPMLLKQLSQPPAAVAPAPSAPAPDAKAGKGGKDAKDGSVPSYEFSNVVVNLAGTMGTRYLKTTFLVTGADNTLKGIFDENKARLTDVTLNVLSSLTLADLEEPGSKNVLREKLVTAYNEALGRKVAEQVYFSDFVVQ